MKRTASASAIDESSVRRDVGLPATPEHSCIRVPFEHYVLIYVDDKRKLRVKESDSIREETSIVFTPEVRQNFLEILGDGIDHHPVTGCTPNASDDRLGGVDPDSDDDSGSDEMTPLRIADTQEVMNYYEGALKRFQQLNCRTVAKAFIKFIEPRKQVRHPYNGGKPPPGSAPGATSDPEKTKPEWWAPGVVHKEPDHLRKDCRIKLLLHIIRELGYLGITAEKLKDVAGDTKRSLKPPSHVEIIYEILRVRKMEERYQKGEASENTVVYVMYCGKNRGDDGSDGTAVTPNPDEGSIENTVQSSGDDKSDKRVVTPNPGKAINENLPIIPMSTNEQAATAIPTGPLYPLRGIFPILGVQPEYICEVPNSTPFRSSSDQLHTTPIQYNAWGVPILHQNTQIPVGYGTPGTIQGFPPLSIHNMPTVLPAEQPSMGRHPLWPLHKLPFSSLAEV
ncbi:Uncharacterized protein F1880_010277 [Penicillium rolfsii]|nr:Uncharacterized protein F1880_010277 [Penicillium rolfsii]